MQSAALTPHEYIETLSEERKLPFQKLRGEILKNLPYGFAEVMAYGMIGYVIPHSIYPKGYHVDPTLPLGLMNIASQKNYIAVYHMGIYASSELAYWFKHEYPKYSNTKPDMGKGCIRFKKMYEIPYELIGELAGKLTPQEWIDIYESILKRK